MLIYIDNHASTMCDPHVSAAMWLYLTDYSAGNPSSTHVAGKTTYEALDTARTQVGTLLGGKPEQVVFTGSATEANNLAIIGTAMRARSRDSGNHIISTQIEHPSVLRPLKHLKQLGFRVTLLPVDEYGRIEVNSVLSAISEDTFLISIMAANNEVGTIQAIGEIFNKIPAQITTHTDAAQSAGRLCINQSEVRADLVSIAAHKMHGPKGIGALCGASEILLEPQVLGNHQEWGLRAGTQNVPGAVGLGVACELYMNGWQEEQAYVAGLRDELQQFLLDHLDDIVINGDVKHRLPGNLNVSFLGVNSGKLLERLPDICMSSGAACTSSRAIPSHVLRAMGLSTERIESSVRMCMSRFNTREEIEIVGSALVQKVKALRQN